MTQTVRDALFVTHQLMDDGMGNVTTVGSQLISDRAGIVWTMPHVSSNITAMDVTQKLTLKKILGNSNVVEASALLTNLGAGVYTSNSAPPEDGMFLRAISNDEARWSFIEDIPFFSADIIEGNIVCVNQVVQTNLIEEKTPGNGITLANALTFTEDVTSLGTIFGDLQGDTVGVHYGRVEGNVVGNVVCAEELSTNRLAEKTPSGGLLVEGDMLPSQDDTYELGNLAAKWSHIFTNDLTACRDATIEGNLTINGQLLANLDVMLTDPFIIDTLCAQTVQTTVLEEKNAGEGISTTGNITPSTNDADSLGSLAAKWAHIYTNNLTVCGNATFEQNISLAGELAGNTVGIHTGDTIGTHTGNSFGTHFGPVIGDVEGNVTASTVCATELQTSMLKEKTPGQGLSIEGDVTPIQDDAYELGNLAAKWAHIFTNDLTVCRDATFEGDVTVVGRLFANVEAAISDPLEVNTLCAQTVQTTLLEEKNAGEGILTSGNITPNSNGVDSLGALDAKWSHVYTSKLTVCQTASFESDVSISGTLEADLVGNVVGDTTGTHTGPVIGDVIGDVTGNTTGTHCGPVKGDVEGNLIGDVTGNTTGTHCGPVKGDVTGNVVGDVVGDLTGNTTGTHFGPVVGDVTGNVTGDVIGDLTGNTTGTHFGPVVGDVTGNVDASTICTPELLVENIIEKTSGITVTGDVIPSANDAYELGNLTAKWSHIFTNDLTVCETLSVEGTTALMETTLTGDLTITGNATISETLTIQDACITGFAELDDLRAKSTTTISVTGDIVPSADDTYELGNLQAKWAHIFTNDLTACQELIVEGSTSLQDATITGNLTVSDTLTTQDACVTGVLELNEMQAKNDANIMFTGDLLPNIDMIYDIGSTDQKINTVWTNDIVICGEILGNVSVDGELSANTLVSFGDVCLDGNLQVNTITPKVGGDIRLIGNLFADNIEGPEGTVQIACVQYTQGEVTTTDGTETIALSIDMVDDNVCFIQTQTVGEGSTGQVIALRTLYTFKYDATANTIIRVGTPSQVKFGDSGTNNWKEIATAVNGDEIKSSSAEDGSVVQIRVAGQAGTTINWRSCTERICV